MFILTETKTKRLIESFRTFQEAYYAMLEYEISDRKDGIYEEDYYTIMEV